MKSGLPMAILLKTVMRSNSSRAGLSLVEIIVAVLVLGILAIGGGALVNQGQIDIGYQKYKRAAIEAANSRLEDMVWANPNAASVIGVQTTNIALNGMSGFVRTTTVSSNSVPDYCCKITVSVEYDKVRHNSIQLETYRSN